MSGSITDTLLQPLYSGGIAIGAQVNAIMYIPMTGGLVMQDANGVNWLITIGTDGRLKGGVQIVF